MLGVYAFEHPDLSAVDMAFIAAWMACRVLDAPEARGALEAAVVSSVYALPGETRQPAEQESPFFDLASAACASAACASGQSATTPPGAASDPLGISPRCSGAGARCGRPGRRC